MISHEELKRNLYYNPDSGDFIREKIRRGKRRGTQAGTIVPNGYLHIAIDGKQYLAHRLAWFYVHGIWPVDQIDHINRDKLDNRITNLREATRSQNLHNSTTPITNKSGVKGILIRKRGRKRFHAQIRDRSGKMVHLGAWDTMEEAIAARAQGMLAFSGDFARVH